MLKWIKKLFKSCDEKKCLHLDSTINQNYNTMMFCNKCQKETCHNVERVYDKRDDSTPDKYICMCCN